MYNISDYDWRVIIMFRYYRLFDYLRKHKIKQKDLIDNKVVSNGTMQRLKNNEYVNTSVLDSICNYLGCDITEIMEYTPNDNTN